MNFSGSYLEEDVTFLVKVIDIPFTDTQQKEYLVQSGKSHYSEIINKEYEPSPLYLKTFNRVYNLNKEKFANDILTLANNLNKKKDIVLVSLLRAGTPIGVLLKRTLKEIYDRDIPHYSISIIRDREIDNIALEYIQNKYPCKEFIFIDGWTGKGVINRELKKFIALYNKNHTNPISNSLYVISDISGVADFSATNEDYLIPSSALNSTISGLVSRSILNNKYIKDKDFHGCKYYNEYIENDLSLWFVDDIMKIISTLTVKDSSLIIKNTLLHNNTNKFIYQLMSQYNIKDINHIKPGIGESTRVLLRRIPFIIIVKDINSKYLHHIIQLAKEKNVKVIENKNLPYMCISIIKNVLKKGKNDKKNIFF